MNSRLDASRVATLNRNFIQITDSFHKTSYGGDQRWFHEVNPRLSSSGCGIIAAVNTYLYLIGKDKISKEEYMSHVNSYIKEYPVSKLLLAVKFGITPFSMKRYLKKNLFSYYKNDTPSNNHISINWNYKNDWENQYKIMIHMLQNNIPIVLGIHSQEKNSLPLYYYDSYDHLKKTYVTSHYVTVTGIYEAQKRLLKVSSWGKEYFIDYDEFNLFRSNLRMQNETSISFSRRVKRKLLCPYYKIANTIGSNILMIHY